MRWELEEIKANFYVYFNYYLSSSYGGLEVAIAATLWLPRVSFLLCLYSA